MHHRCYGELLPALDITPDNVEQLEIKEEVTVPEIRGLSVNEAITKLNEAELKGNLNTEKEINKDEIIIKDQLPKPGINVYKGTAIELSV